MVIIVLIYLLKISENVTKTIDINTQETSTLVKNQPRKQFDNTNVKNKTFNANKVTDNNFNELSDNQQNLSNQKFVFSKERDDKIMRMAKEEVLSKAFQDKTLVKMGFNQEAVTKLYHL